MNPYGAGFGVGLGFSFIGIFYLWAAAFRESQGAIQHATADALVAAAFFGSGMVAFLIAHWAGSLR
jgi:hypothetical protein